MKIQIKRIYEAPSTDDGYRIFVDRLWPRGVKKENTFLDEWNKEIAPSPELRKWFNHNTERFNDFAKHYGKELDKKKGRVATHPEDFGKKKRNIIICSQKH